MPVIIGDIKLFSLDDLSETLGVTTVTLRSYIAKEKIKARKMGGKWFVSEDSLREYFNSFEKPDETLEKIFKQTPRNRAESIRSTKESS